MKNLEEFYKGYITEMGRTKGSKNKPKEWPENPKEIANDPEIKNAVSPKDVDLHKIDEVDTIEWDVDEPAKGWEAELAKFEVNDLSDSAYAISSDLDDGTDFFVQGEAGWAKTSIIKELAKKYGYHVLTVYLDKAQATDLGGIPVPVKHKKTGKTMQDYAMPGWLIYMLENPNKKILLFFDEMNQAQPDVLNALMPIILEHVICGIKFPNMLVGAAGNLEDENDSLWDFSKPLASRLDEIQWETHTDEAWRGTFNWLHAKYDKVLGKEFIDKVEALKDYWKSPRDIERYIIEPVYNNKSGNTTKSHDRASNILRKIKNKCIDPKTNKESRKFNKDIEELAEYISNVLKGNTTSTTDGKSSRSKSKGMDQVDENSRDCILNALQKGYYLFAKSDGGDNKRYLATLENIIGGPDDSNTLFNSEETGVTREVLNKLIREMEASGKSVKYKTNEEGLADAKKNKWEVL